MQRRIESLRREFEFTQRFTCLIQQLLALQINGLAVFVRFLYLTQLDIQCLQRVFGFDFDLLLLGFLRIDFGQIAGDLSAALAEPLLHFALAQQINLQAMQALRQFIHLPGQRFNALHALRQRRIGLNRALAGFIRQHLLCTYLTFEIVDFLLARQHAILFGVGRIETYREPTDQVPLPRHQASPCGQL